MRGKWLVITIAIVLAVITMNSLAQPTVKCIEIQTVRGSQIYVPVGTTVTVYVKIHASGGPVQGLLTAVIKKDIIGEPDQVYVTLKKYIEVSEDQTKTIKMGTFVAKDKTTDDWWAVGAVREYFTEVYFNGQRLNPDETNPSTRPFVKTY